MKIPVIDFTPFLYPPTTDTSAESLSSSSLSRRKHDLVNQVRIACETHGFFYIIGIKKQDEHKQNQNDDENVKKQSIISTQAMSKAITQIQRFFNSDKEFKEQCSSKHSKLYRGYTQIGGGNNCVVDKEANLPELKESFTIGAEGEGISPMHGENLWPRPRTRNTTTSNTSGTSGSNTTTTSCSCSDKNNEEIEFCDSFRADMTNYFDGMLNLSRHVAHVLALSLDLKKDFFTSRMEDPVAQLVAFQYPPEKLVTNDGEKQKQISCGTHTDCGFLTLLTQTAPGLEVYSKSTQSWHLVEPIENAVLVNLGDLTQFWTKGRYKSTPHRVHNTSIKGIDRHSLVFFANCDFHARLDDIHMDEEESSSKSNNTDEGKVVVSAGEYILEKLGLMWLMNENT